MVRSPLSALALAVLLSPALVAPVRAADNTPRVLSARDLTPTDASEVNRALARESRHKAMEMLKGIEVPAGEQRADLIFRLAEMETEEAVDLALTGRAAYIAALDACSAQQGCDPSQIKEADYLAESLKWRRRALNHYVQVLETFPSYARADQVLYGQATALVELDRGDEAALALTTLVRLYPDSALAPDAYVLIGERAFDRGDLPRATTAYQRAVGYRDAELSTFARYKLAWCYYNAGRLDDTIHEMKTVVAQSQGKVQLQDEALRDLTRFYAESGAVDELERYLTSLGRTELIPPTLSRMAEIHLEQGRNALAIQTWQRVLARDPSSKDAPKVQSAIVGAQMKIGDKAALLAALQTERKTYGPSSVWARGHSAEPEVLKAAREALEKDLRTVAVAAHDEARRIGSGEQARAAYALANATYEAYLAEFPDGTYNVDMRYAYAELLYKLKRYDAAYAQYTAVVDADPKGQYVKFCAESAIFAADQMVKQGAGAPSKQNPALTEWEERLIASSDRFVQLFPQEPKIKNIVYKTAYLLYNKDQLQEASARFRTVIAMDPGSTEAEQAANLILDSFALARDWKNLADVSKAFYDQPGLGSKAFKAEVYGVYENASLKRIEAELAESGLKRPAADAWLRFAADFPSSKNADLALNNAAATYDQLGDLTQSMVARQALVDRFPASRFYADAVAGLAFGHESLAEFELAAAGYEKLYSLAPQHKAAREALYSAAVFRGVLGQTDLAIADYQHLLQSWPDDARAPDLALAMGRLYADTRQWDRAAAVYQAAFTQPRPQASLAQTFEARRAYGEALSHLPGTEAKLTRHWQDTLAAYDAAAKAGADLTPIQDVVGEIRYRLAAPVLANYRALTLDPPAGRLSPRQENDALRAALNRKLSALSEAEAALKGVIDTRSGTWGLAALVDLGQLYENMAWSLEHAPAPSYLTPEQKQMYSDGIADMVYQQNQKAIAAYDLCLQQSFKLSLYNQNTKTSLGRLAQLDPIEHAPMTESVLAAAYLSRASTRSGYIETP